MHSVSVQTGQEQLEFSSLNTFEQLNSNVPSNNLVSGAFQRVLQFMMCPFHVFAMPI